jgi:hypothetical protein
VNKQKAIDSFLTHLGGLSRLPLITDSEMESLYGEEVAEALARLGRLNRQESICFKCASKCCHLVHCEFFVPSLSQCPVYSFRPVLCRMHFCHLFAGVDENSVIGLGDIFLESLSSAEILDKKKSSLLDSPSFTHPAPRLVASILPVIKGLRERSLEEKIALETIHDMAASYRIS